MPTNKNATKMSKASRKVKLVDAIKSTSLSEINKWSKNFLILGTVVVELKINQNFF